MLINITNYQNISFKTENNKQKIKSMEEKISEIGKETVLPSGNTNYSKFNEKLVKEIVEGLYIVDCLIENGTKGVDKLYPTLSRFNQSESPNVQVFLAGIYRKIQVPDAFGPLCSMLIRNSINPNKSVNFDPNEEVGGAILEYIRNKNATEVYKH